MLGVELGHELGVVGAGLRRVEDAGAEAVDAAGVERVGALGVLDDAGDEHEDGGVDHGVAAQGAEEDDGGGEDDGVAQLCVLCANR